MGFPGWTLWGMGLAAFGALIFMALSLAGQSPGFVNRLGPLRVPIATRARTFTGYAFALLLLAMGFFLAGVPLDSDESLTADGAAIEPASPPTLSTVEDETLAAEGSQDTNSTPTPSPTRATPVTGAFAGPPSAETTLTPLATSLTLTSTVVASPTTILSGEASATPPTPVPTSPVILTDDASETTTPTPTISPTPTPTTTPTPSLTPTPISGVTGVITTSGSTIWLRRSPGGQNLTLVSDGEIVILGPGHAYLGGIIWRQVVTLNGFSGWLPESFLETAS